jgi:hypothetical protein
VRALSACFALVLVGLAFDAGSRFSRWRADRARRPAPALQAKEAKAPRDPNRPRLLTHYKGGRVVGRELEDTTTGARTALPLDGPDPREPLTPKED